jgi:uncharacterized protein YlxP (DUF503 family)
MFVGICRVELGLHDNFSLKGKRSVVRRLITRCRNRFNLAMNEVENLDSLTSAVLGFTVLGNSHAFVNSCIDKIVNFIEREAEGTLEHYSFEIENY